MLRLYINIDHVATVRQARRTDEPDPVRAAVLAELGGADGVTVHLREDRRHIQDRDVELLMATVRTGVNLELAAVPEMVDLTVGFEPMAATLVPERREEITTEGGLDLLGPEARERVAAACDALAAKGIRTSLFIDPDPETVAAAAELGVEAIELHTGAYAGCWNGAHVTSARKLEDELGRLSRMAAQARGLGLDVHAGHGLTYENVAPVARITEIEELNIGHSVIARAVFTGIERAVADMKAILRRARSGQVPI